MPESPANKRPRVLVVDAEESVRALARTALEGVGLEVVEAADAGAALAQATEQAPRLVLVNFAMPEGFDLCVELRRRDALERVPIVAMTERDDIDSVRRSYEVGATDFVAQPVHWLFVAQRVLSLLRASGGLEELRESRRRLARAQQIARLGSWTFDPLDGELRVSPEARRVVEGLPKDPVAFADVMARVHEADRERVRARFRDDAAGQDAGPFHFRVVAGDGSVRHVSACVESTPGETVVSGIVQDVTEQVRAQEQIRFLAYHDSLTSLGNRVSFKERLSQAIQRTRRGGGCVGLIFLDLDGFKQVNDSLGHEAGDRLLCEVADRLRGSVRETDSVRRAEDLEGDSFVARLGGDEFTIVLEDVAAPREVAKVAARIAGVLAQPIALGSHDFTVSASMGLATWPHDGEDVETLLRNTDVAMYQAKAQGPGNFTFYSQSMNVATRRRVELETKLRRAVDQSQLAVYFQPIASATDGQIVGSEALVRWCPPGEGPVAPDVFLSVAEDSGVIRELGSWVLRTSCEQAVAWRDAGVPVPVSVNCSARQIEPGLPEEVASILESTGLAPSDLRLEIDEAALGRNEERVLPVLEALCELGVRLTLDGFGTGPASLRTLRRYPIDCVKIDRSFVRELGSRAEDRALIRAILAMARALDLGVIAVGVESEEQADFLRAHGCDAIQGYGVGLPVPAADFEASWIRGRARRSS